MICIQFASTVIAPEIVAFPGISPGLATGLSAAQHSTRRR